jgi:uncharacterized protein (TIGR02466 family)
MSKQEDYIPKKSDDDNYEVHGLFPIPVYIRENYLSEDDILCVESAKSLPLSPQVDNNSLYGDRSENSYVLNQPHLIPLKKKIQQHITEYANCVLALAGEYVITQSWISVKKPGQKHIMHSHGNSIISGTFYFGNPDETDGLTFMKTEVSNCWQMNPLRNPNVNNQFSFTEITVKVENNMLILFPSFLAHKVAGNNTEKERYCLAFNCVPKHGLGFEKDLTELEWKRIDRSLEE